ELSMRFFERAFCNKSHSLKVTGTPRDLRALKKLINIAKKHSATNCTNSTNAFQLRTTNPQILANTARIFSPRRARSTRRKQFRVLRVLRVLRGEFFGVVSLLLYVI